MLTKLLDRFRTWLVYIISLGSYVHPLDLANAIEKTDIKKLRNATAAIYTTNFTSIKLSFIQSIEPKFWQN